MNIVPDSAYSDSIYSNIFDDSVEIVSLERAAALIEEERNNDERGREADYRNIFGKS